MKRLLLFIIFCACIGAFAAAQTAESAEPSAEYSLEDVEAAEEGPPKKGFAKFWANFTELLFTPQIHKPFSVAGGLEMTQNDRISILPELFVMVDYELSRNFGFGVRGGVTFASKKPSDRLVSVMEGVFFGRFYVYDFGWIRPFIQTGVGFSVDREQEYEVFDALGEVSFGARAHLTGWFLETSFRVGYPFRIAFGLAVGHSFLP